MKLRFIAVIALILVIISGCSSYTPAQSATAASEPEVYEFGETGTVGNFAFTVRNMRDTDELGGQTTEGKFVVVEITAKNIGKEPASLYERHFALVDGEGRIFDPFASYVEFGMERFAGTINPGISKTAEVAFEVPSDAEIIAVVAEDEFPSRDYILLMVPGA